MAFVRSSWNQHLARWLRPFQPLVDAIKLWLDADGLRMSAAMTFYGLLSLSPLVLLIVGLLGWWMDRSVVESTLLDQVRGVMGERGASVVQGALASAQAPAQGRLASIAAFVLLLSGATGVFVELQNSLNKLWRFGADEPPPPQKAWWKLATLRLRGLAYVLVVGFLMLVTMVLSTAIKMFTQLAGNWLNMERLVVSLVNEGVSLVVMTVLFVGLMRIGTGRKPQLRYLVLGAVVSSTLFMLSKQALAWYLSTAAVVSAYGAAGSLVVVLIWIYVTSAILLLGASCAKAWEMQHRRNVLRSEASLAGLPPERAMVPCSVGSQGSQRWPEI
nr:YihY/virulence factor BrkB family protein [Comamonas jiangduensis]